MDVNEHERLTNITLRTQIKVKEQLVVRKDMDVNEQGTSLLLLFYIPVKVVLFVNNEHNLQT